MRCIHILQLYGNYGSHGSMFMGQHRNKSSLKILRWQIIKET